MNSKTPELLTDQCVAIEAEQQYTLVLQIFQSKRKGRNVACKRLIAAWFTNDIFLYDC